MTATSSPTTSSTPWLTLVVRIKLVSVANLRGWRTVHANAKNAQDAVWAAIVDTYRGRVVAMPYSEKRMGARIEGTPTRVHVRMVRYGRRLFDPDNNTAAFKAAQDALAFALGVDDGDRARISWEYAQARCKRGEERVEISIFNREGT